MTPEDRRNLFITRLAFVAMGIMAAMVVYAKYRGW